MSIIETFFYFLLALTLLIAVHEWGHFIVARMVGVKVLRFSIGFGRPLLRYLDKKGTEYVLAMFPLGGYVKMLDEEEVGELPPEEKQHAFNQKPVWARMAVVSAGPALNMLFAFLALWLMFVIGIKTFAPIVGEVEPNSIAAKAGLKPQDEIITLDAAKILSWRDFQMQMMNELGERRELALSVKNKSSSQTRQLTINLAQWQLDYRDPDIFVSLGIKPYFPLLLPIIGEVLPNSPASQAGLQPGDKILMMNNQTIQHWYQVLQVVKDKGSTPLLFKVERANQKEVEFSVIPTIKTTNGHSYGFIGIKVMPQQLTNDWLRTQQYSFFAASHMAWQETIELTSTSLQMVWKFLTGKVSLRNVGGPIGIAQGAGQSAQIGLAYYLSFLALVSISLGVLNILPVPVLDGGHLLFYVIEFVLGRPLSRMTREKALGVGTILLLALTALAVFNDVVRLIK